MCLVFREEAGHISTGDGTYDMKLNKLSQGVLQTEKWTKDRILKHFTFRGQGDETYLPVKKIENQENYLEVDGRNVSRESGKLCQVLLKDSVVQRLFEDLVQRACFSLKEQTCLLLKLEGDQYGCVPQERR